MSDIQKRAFDVIVSNLDSKTGDVMLETAFAGAGVDSITFVKIVVALEGEFDFEFDDEMLLITVFPTIKSMIEYVESKVI
ncbi:MAG: acyl carrier protein [Candidatus Methanofastidiosa archaeon]|nr:acyl carrier protein [Candidatus Methanofastidiosa archaeon]